tara:strand:- start:9311 stop:9604 length:294 start_codon:yes stop_codon:yes gene_type:complete
MFEAVALALALALGWVLAVPLWVKLQRARADADMYPTSKVAFPLQLGDLIVLMRDRTVYLSVEHEPGRADIIEVQLGDDVDPVTARAAIAHAERPRD